MSTASRCGCAAATPTTRLLVEMRPSFAPSTAARSQAMWLGAMGLPVGHARRIAEAARAVASGGRASVRRDDRADRGPD